MENNNINPSESHPLEEFQVNTFPLYRLSVSSESLRNSSVFSLNVSPYYEKHFGTFYSGTDDSKRDEAAGTQSSRNVTFPFWRR